MGEQLGDCGVCGVAASAAVAVTADGYSVPRCADHLDSPPYQAEARLEQLIERDQELAGKLVRRVRADGLPQGIRDCCEECSEVAWESCFLRGQCRRYLRAEDFPAAAPADPIARGMLAARDRGAVSPAMADGNARGERPHIDAPKSCRFEEAFSELLERWHSSDSSEPIHEWLGISFEQYACLVEKGPLSERLSESRTRTSALEDALRAISALIAAPQRDSRRVNQIEEIVDGVMPAPPAASDDGDG